MLSHNARVVDSCITDFRLTCPYSRASADFISRALWLSGAPWGAQQPPAC